MRFLAASLNCKQLSSKIHSGRNSNRTFHSLLLRYIYTSNTCLPIISACFREMYGEELTQGVSLTDHALSQSQGFPTRMTSPFSSGVASSVTSSLHENYSMGEFKGCGVHSVEQLAVRHIHSLATQRMQELQEKWKASRYYFHFLSSIT